MTFEKKSIASFDYLMKDNFEFVYISNWTEEYLEQAKHNDSVLFVAEDQLSDAINSHVRKDITSTICVMCNKINSQLCKNDKQDYFWKIAKAKNIRLVIFGNNKLLTIKESA